MEKRIFTASDRHMPRVAILLIGVLLVVQISALAQDRELSGVITSEEGEPLIGVNITVKGTTIGTISDNDGRFKLMVPAGEATVVFSYIGYEPQEVRVTTQTDIRVMLQPDVKQLQSVVVVGYGGQDKRALTSAVGQVTNENIRNLKVPTFENLLKGQVAGVQLSQTTGHPGAGIYIRVRGTGSINAGNEPLYVIDGYPIESLPYDNRVNLLSFLNPSDIESITVLKDASASAIYGSRGSNGVVLITTKSAQKGKTDVEISSYYGFQTYPKRGRFDVMNAEEFATFRRNDLEDAMRLRGNLGANESLSKIDDDRVRTYAGTPGGYDALVSKYGPYFGVTGPGTDWFDVIYNKNAPLQQHNATLRTGTEKSKLLVSLDYYTIDGIIRGTDYERASLRINGDVNIGKRFTFGFRLNPTYNVRNLGGSVEGFPDLNLIGKMLGASPITPLYQPNGQPTFTIGVSPENFFYPNPLNYLKYFSDKRVDFRTLASSYLEYEIIKGLRFRTNVGTDLNFARRRNVYPYAQVGNPVGVFNPSINNNIDPTFVDVAAGSEQISNWLLENTLTFNKTFGDHSIEALAGHAAQQQTYYSLAATAGRYADDLANYTLTRSDRLQLPGGALSIGVSEGFDSFVYKLESYFGRIFYSYKQRYDLSLSLRTDGSTRFSKDVRWGTFPAVSAGWNFFQEPFIRDNAPTFISDAKIRASYGITGNNNIGSNFAYLPLLATSNYTFNDAQSNGRVIDYADRRLEWEKNRTFDAGLDLRFFQDRLGLQLDYYRRETYDLILARPIPTITGFAGSISNIGNVVNKGIEVTLDGDVLQGSALQWTTNFNISFNRNEVVALNDNNDPIIVGDPFGGRTITRIGQPMALFYGYLTDGVFRTEEEAMASGIAEGASGTPAHAGVLKIRDINGDRKINANDATVIGNPNPDFIFGFTNNLYYRDFDLSVQISGSYGNDVMVSSYEFLRNIDGPFNVLKDVEQRWRSPENPGNGIYPTTNYPEWRQYVRLANDDWIIDGSHIKINNVTLGYTVPVAKIGALKGLKSIRLYTSIQNALLIANKALNNPDASLGASTLLIGFQRGPYPLARVYTFGTTIKF